VTPRRLQVHSLLCRLPRGRTPSELHHISVKPTDVVQSVRAQVEKVRLNFIASEIETARAFAFTARTLYESGSKAHTDTAADMAWKAYKSANAKLKDLGVGQELRNDFSRKLREVRAVLEALPTQELKQARLRVVGKNDKR